MTHKPLEEAASKSAASGSNGGGSANAGPHSPEADPSARAGAEDTAEPSDAHDEAEETEAPSVALMKVLDDAAPPRTLSEEWALTVAAIERSDVRWLRVAFVELPHFLRAVIAFPSEIWANAVRLILMGTRVFLSARAKSANVSASTSGAVDPGVTPTTPPPASSPIPDSDDDDVLTPVRTPASPGPNQTQ